MSVVSDDQLKVLRLPSLWLAFREVEVAALYLAHCHVIGGLILKRINRETYETKTFARNEAK
jgi:hypothetical protein